MSNAAARKILTDNLDACERGAFPGSAASRKETAAILALAAFDRAHPEVIAAILAPTPADDGPTDDDRRAWLAAAEAKLPTLTHPIQIKDCEYKIANLRRMLGIEVAT